MEWRVVPIETWPGELTVDRQTHRFRKTVQRSWGRGTESGVDWSATMSLLERELEQLDAENVLLQMAVTDRDIRNDGWIRANARPEHPGVILTFDSRFGPHRPGALPVAALALRRVLGSWSSHRVISYT